MSIWTRIDNFMSRGDKELIASAMGFGFLALGGAAAGTDAGKWLAANKDVWEPTVTALADHSQLAWGVALAGIGAFFLKARPGHSLPLFFTTLLLIPVIAAQQVVLPSLPARLSPLSEGLHYFFLMWMGLSLPMGHVLDRVFRRGTVEADPANRPMPVRMVGEVKVKEPEIIGAPVGLWTADPANGHPSVVDTSGAKA